MREDRGSFAVADGLGFWWLVISVVALFVFLATTGLAHAGQSSATTYPKCTRVGTSKADVMHGTSGRDVICGRGGDDTLIGRGGNDIIRGGSGNDKIVAKQGDDTLDGGAGDDVLYGGTGSDDATGGSGDDALHGADGNDDLQGGAGDDEITGEAGDDALFGQPDDDQLSGGPGDDTLDGGQGDDVLDGGAGDNDCVNDAGDTFASCDSTAPHLTDLTVTPDSIDTSQGEQTVTIEARITDNLSGTGQPYGSYLNAYGPSGQYQQASLDASDRIAGDDVDSTYRVAITLPRYSEGGQWKLDFNLLDRNQNYREVDPAALASSGLPTGFEQTAPGDVQAPTLKDLSIDPASVDTSQGPQFVMVTARITDDLSGTADQGGLTDVYFESPSGHQYAAAHLQKDDRISGDSLDGIYQSQMRLPQYAEAGTWTLKQVALGDNAHNRHVLEGQELSDAGFDRSFQQTGQGDTTPPVITGISFQPDTVDTSRSAQQITGEVHITDDLSGFGGDEYHDFGGGIGFQSPSLHHSTYMPLHRWERISGTPQDGVYAVTMDVPRYSELGDWNIGGAQVYDSAGNLAIFDAGDLTGDGFDSVFHNVALTDDPPPPTP